MPYYAICYFTEFLTHHVHTSKSINVDRSRSPINTAHQNRILHSSASRTIVPRHLGQTYGDPGLQTDETLTFTLHMTTTTGSFCRAGGEHKGARA